MKRVSLGALLLMVGACQSTPAPRPVPAPAVQADERPPLERIVDEAIRAHEQPVAVAVVNVADGRALALGRHRGADPERSAFRPGSSVKPLTAWIAARHGVLSSDERIACTGKHAKHSDLSCFATHGEHEVAHAIEVSCNVFFYELGLRVGHPRLRSELQTLGFGRAPGLLGDESSERTAALLATGHGPFEATVVQLANAYAELARRLGDSPADRAIARGMVSVVQGDEGTGKAAAVAGLEIAGKTGTAEAERFGQPPREGAKENGWFVGWAPASEPQLVIAVLVQEGGTGGQSAAPIAGQILRSWQALK